MNCIPYRYAILVLPLDTRLVFIVEDFGKALLKTKSSPIFFSYKHSERKPLFEIAHCKYVLTAPARCSQYKISHIHDVLRDYIIAEVSELLARPSCGAFSSLCPFPVWYFIPR